MTLPAGERANLTIKFYKQAKNENKKSADRSYLYRRSQKYR